MGRLSGAETVRVWCSQRAVAFLSLCVNGEWRRRRERTERAAELSGHGREATPRSFPPLQPALPHGL